MKTDKINKFTNEKNSETVCDQCSSIMEPEIREKKSKYGKERTVFVCSNCGHRFRKRTQNEILRDLGYRD